MILEPKHHQALSSTIRRSLTPYIKRRSVKIAFGLMGITVCMISSKSLALQIIVQTTILVGGLAAILIQVPSKYMLKSSFIGMIFIPVTGVFSQDIANVLSVYVFLCIVLGIAGAMIENLRQAIKKSQKS